MPLVNMHDMLHHAYENNYAVGAFDLVSLDFLEAVIAAAEKSRASVILSVAEPHFNFYDFELLMPAVEAAARRASVPVAIQLDHGSNLESADKAIRQGCNGIMLDASGAPLADNIKLTQSVVKMAHECGVPVVGELGYVAGMEGEGAEQHPGESSFTNPVEAKAYCEKTGVDFLAVSIGTVQGRMKGRAKLDFQRLKHLNQTVDLPLVIHGGSGLNESQFRKMTMMGVVKINYYTALSDVAAKVMREQAKQNPNGSFTELKQGVKQAISDEVERCLRLWGSAGRAAEVLEQCQPWLTVEHLVVHNVRVKTGQQLKTVLSEGRNLLAEIPGVRSVSVGEAIKQGEKYQCCWVFQLTHKKVIDSLYKHPNYIAFSNMLSTQLHAEELFNVNYILEH
ncbi:MAG: class II fructose-bisphosphate aldolase family protein [Gammaproteobacteria bacterium]|nr:class II fructose-bisphosphate aldolase family protein [Gammaproteobacteria bacterium]